MSGTETEARLAHLISLEPSKLPFAAMRSIVDTSPDGADFVPKLQEWLATWPAKVRAIYPEGDSFFDMDDPGLTFPELSVHSEMPSWPLIRHLTIGGSPEDINQSLERIDLRGVENLQISGWVDRQSFLLLANDMRFPSLRRLSISPHALDTNGLECFARSNTVTLLSFLYLGWLDKSLWSLLQRLLFHDTVWKSLECLSCRTPDPEGFSFIEDSCPRLQTLYLDGCSRENMESLASCRDLCSRLNKLSISGFTDGTLEALSRCNDLESLVSLSAFNSYGEISYTDIVSMNESAFAPHLKEFAIDRPMQDQNWKTLAQLPMKGVHTLCLPHSNLDNNKIDLLTRAEWFASLTRLDLSRNEIGQEGLSLLLDKLTTEQVAVLNLFMNPIQQLDQIGAYGWRALRSLNLGLTELSGKSLQMLAETPMPHLVDLSLAGNELTPAAATSISVSEKASTLERFDLSTCKLNDSIARLLFNQVQWPKLQTLRLANNSLSYIGVRYVASNRSLADLFDLDLSTNACFDEGAQELGAASFVLVALNVYGCGITNKSLTALTFSQAVKNVDSIQYDKHCGPISDPNGLKPATQKRMQRSFADNS